MIRLKNVTYNTIFDISIGYNEIIKFGRNVCTYVKNKNTEHTINICQNTDMGITGFVVLNK